MTDTLSNGAVPATRRRWVLPLVAVALLAGGVAVGVALADRDSPAQASTSTQVANMTAACTTWMTSSAAAGGSTAWCSDMTAWMSQRVTSGQMMGSMMWGDPDRMLSICRSWVQSGAAGVPAVSWCDGLVTWMRQHMNGDWNNWMMNGSMMGR